MITLRDRTLDFFNNSAESGLQIRQGQIEMAAEVCTAFETNKPLAVEAEVGIGKSYAYLVPAIYEFIWKRQQIVIATSTIALQEQLEKDIHQILKTMNFDVDVVIAKGMKNYICKHRLYGLEIRNKRDMLIQKLWDIVQINGQDIAEIGMKIPQKLLDKIVVRNFGNDHCHLCDFSYSCEYAVIRRKIAQESNIVICNQNMLVSHLVNKKKGHVIFNPDCASYIIDEAHNLESKFRDAFSVSYSRNDIIKLMNNYSDSVTYEKRQTAKKLAGSICETVQKLYSELNRQIHEQQNISDECGNTFFFNRTREISNFIVELIKKIGRFEIFIGTDIYEIKRFFNSVIIPNNDNIIWIENDKNIRLCICKKDISRDIAKLLFGKQNVILTSATISCRQTGYPTEKYEYFLDSIHFPTNALISEPKKSPFDYDKNTMLYCSAALPNPRKKDEYRKASIAEIVRLLGVTNGKTLILFTSKTDMEYVYKRLSNMHLPYKIFIQYRGSSQTVNL